MIVIKTISEAIDIISDARKNSKSIGFVPTMGYLHEGHCSLIRKAREDNDFVVVSIFVNPTQFGVNEDLSKYPRDFERDYNMCLEAKADLIFFPEVEEMYPGKSYIYVDNNDLGNTMCGASRPGHFRGVTTVVSKLFNIIQPDKAYFGEKDAQQLLIIKKMVSDLNFPVKVISCPTIRESDGLAMSSRNSYLSTEERKKATVLIKALMFAKDMIEKGERDAERIISEMEKLIHKTSESKIDYISIVDGENLSPIKTVKNNILVALAVKIGKTRLIDNILIRVS